MWLFKKKIASLVIVAALKHPGKKHTSEQQFN